MKVAVYEGMRSMRFDERPKPEAGPGEAVVRVKYCGICGSDLHSYLHEGTVPSGLVMGHEVVGTVAEIGSGVEGWRPGERVVVQANGRCGECYFCRHGLPNLCVHAMERTNGISPGFDGGLAPYVRVRFPRDMLHRIPDEVSFEDAVLVDTICVALGAIRKSRFRLGDNAVVVGAGAIGLCAVQLLRIGGARRITVIQPSPKKRELAIRLGADVALSPIEEGAALGRKVRSLCGGIGADVAYECAGTKEAFQTVSELVRSGGQVMLLGVNEEPTPIVEVGLIVREVEMKGSIAYDEEDVRICIDLLAKGRFNTKGMISDIISLDDVIEKGFERFASSKGLVKIVVAP
ncbi:MAG TPA: alcohol dehydrogenase catalytic domain-containing protein [Syntrophorhabdales bacterium]|nr:alcohol dehydrogenase catalytic domain-containing protein [Syntrophorhabdales bacterium]